MAAGMSHLYLTLSVGNPELDETNTNPIEQTNTTINHQRNVFRIGWDFAPGGFMAKILHRLLYRTRKKKGLSMLWRPLPTRDLHCLDARVDHSMKAYIPLRSAYLFQDARMCIDV